MSDYGYAVREERLSVDEMRNGGLLINRQGQVNEQMNSLRAELAELEQAVEELSKRLMPVCRDVHGGLIEAREGKEDGLVPLAAELEVCGGRVKSVKCEIANLIRGLQV